MADILHPLTTECRPCQDSYPYGAVSSVAAALAALGSVSSNGTSRTMSAVAGRSVWRKSALRKAKASGHAPKPKRTISAGWAQENRAGAESKRMTRRKQKLPKLFWRGHEAVCSNSRLVGGVGDQLGHAEFSLNARRARSGRNGRGESGRFGIRGNIVSASYGLH
jgi:hypothetical protein